VVHNGRILRGDALAQKAGICVGIGVAAARALAPNVQLLARNPAREGAALQALACWAGRFTPRVSLTTDTLLLEIGSCLRLFGGLSNLVRLISDSAQSLDFSTALAVAPTPLGAQWLAEQNVPVFCTDLSRLPQHLEQLPVSVFPKRVAEALHRFGAETLGDVRRLPAGQLARRIGVESLHQLARAFGEAPDLRVDFVFPERFALSLQLPAVVENASALVFAARRLVLALAGWLSVRQSGVRSMVLHLRHEYESGVTPLLLQFADLTADGERFAGVLRERLERMELTAPVDSLCLEASEVTPLAGCSGTLFNDAFAEQGSMNVLLERLSARLGEPQLYRLAVQDDHRPECATRKTTQQEKLQPSKALPLSRPLWLLRETESLREVDGRPYRRGQLELLAGPERIESGWWGNDEAGDVGDIRRDYFVARSQDKRWLWIYRECREPGGWFLHGYFS
jgi:protein ImuB